MWGVSCPFASDTSPTWIDRGGLGKRLTGTRRLGKCKILIRNQLVKSKVEWSFFSYNNPRQEHNVYSKLFNFGESLLPVIWYNVHCSLRWFFTLNNVTAYFCYWAQQVNLQEVGCYSWFCFLQQGLQLVDRYRRCKVKSHARAAHERKRERGRGIERPCHFPTLACSHAAGFASHSRWNCLLAGRWSCSQVKHFATSPWKWHVGKCWLFSQAYNVQPYKPAISNCRFYFFFRREGKTYSVPRRRSRDKTSIGRAWSQVTGPRYGHILKVKNDHRSKFSNLSNWKEEAWKKNQGFILWLTHGHILWLAYYHIVHQSTSLFTSKVNPRLKAVLILWLTARFRSALRQVLNQFWIFSHTTSTCIHPLKATSSDTRPQIQKTKIF